MQLMKLNATDATECNSVSAPQNHVVTPRTSRPISWHGDSHHVPEPRCPSQDFETRWNKLMHGAWKKCGRVARQFSFPIWNWSTMLSMLLFKGVAGVATSGHQLNWTDCTLKRLFLKPWLHPQIFVFMDLIEGLAFAWLKFPLCSSMGPQVKLDQVAQINAIQ